MPRGQLAQGSREHGGHSSPPGSLVKCGEGRSDRHCVLRERCQGGKTRSSSPGDEPGTEAVLTEGRRDKYHEKLLSVLEIQKREK